MKTISELCRKECKKASDMVVDEMRHDCISLKLRGQTDDIKGCMKLQFRGLM